MKINGLEWTDQHIKVFLNSIKSVDGSCSASIQECITDFLNNTSWDLLKRLDIIGPTIDWDYSCEWIDVRPEEKTNEN